MGREKNTERKKEKTERKKGSLSVNDFHNQPIPTHTTQHTDEYLASAAVFRPI
jgi:hypothetical protein